MSDLIPLIETPYRTIDDVVAGLTALERVFRERRDRRGVFASAYLGITEAVKRRSDAAGFFEDDVWVRAYDVAFGNLYRQALLDFERGDHQKVPKSWRFSFETALSGDGLVFQDLLLGINAHINLDLGVAAAETAPGADIGALEHDFREISVLLGELLDDVQDRIGRVSPWMGLLDWIGMRHDEVVFTFALGGSRDLAWNWARRFATTDAARLPQEIDALDHVVATLAAAIRKPHVWVRPVLLAIRLREPKDVGRVLDALS
jgi:hypothetical protein